MGRASALGLYGTCNHTDATGPGGPTCPELLPQERTRAVGVCQAVEPEPGSGAAVTAQVPGARVRVPRPTGPPGGPWPGPPEHRLLLVL